MDKKGLSSVIITVLLFLLVLISVLIIAGFVLPFFSSQNEITEAKTTLFTQRVILSNVSGPDEDGNFVLLISRGSASMVLNDTYTIQTFPINVDVFSVVDLSTSMNCNVSVGDSYSNSTTCTNNGGVWQGPLNSAKGANHLLIDNILNLSGNYLGLFGFSTNTSSWLNDPNKFHELSNNITSLKSKVSGWGAGGATCTCCGIKKAHENFNVSSDNKKIMILMSDGNATQKCENYGNPVLTPNEQALFAAQQAKNDNITIYSISMGSLIDTQFMEEIAEIGGGQHFAGNISNILNIYTSISEQIIETYTTTIRNQFLIITFYNQTNSGSVRINDPPTEPFQTQSFSLLSPVENPNKIEIYLGIILSDGREVITNYPLDVWIAPSS